MPSGQCWKHTQRQHMYRLKSLHVGMYTQMQVAMINGKGSLESDREPRGECGGLRMEKGKGKRCHRSIICTYCPSPETLFLIHRNSHNSVKDWSLHLLVDCHLRAGPASRGSSMLTDKHTQVGKVPCPSLYHTHVHHIQTHTHTQCMFIHISLSLKPRWVKRPQGGLSALALVLLNL